MLYDNALDDGSMLIDNPPCLVFTTLCEDKNDICRWIRSTVKIRDYVRAGIVDVG